MRQVYTSPDSTQVGYYKSILDEAGIACSVRNEDGESLEGTGNALAPTLYVDDDADHDQALNLIKAEEAKAEKGGEEWKCPACHETNAPNLDACWNCDMARPEVS